MSLPRLVRSATAAVLVLVACTGEVDPQATGTVDPSRSPTLTLIGENIELLPGDDLALRIGFEPAEATAQVIVTFRPDTARVTVCPLRALDEPLPEPERCRRAIGSGVREPVGTGGLAALAVVVTGDAAVRADITLEFAERGRSISLLIPRMRAPVTGPCDDNRCNPFFVVEPAIRGPFGARATWEGPEATLVLLQGRVRGRSLTATGVPYAEPARADGSSPLSIGTRLSAPGEYALVLRHRRLQPGEPPLRDVLVEASWPERD